MKATIASVITLVAMCAAAPRQKRFSFYDLYPVYNPYVGAGAWAGTGFNPFFFNPFSMMPMVPVIPKPWYEGDNVCVDKKEADAPEFLKEWWNDDSFGSSNFQQQSKQCRGSNTKYVCLSREMTKDGNKMVATKYECCHGFVRPSNGAPGCVESSGKETDATLSPFLENGDYKSQYSYMSSNFGT